ncbi:iron-siderophore ABC transporter substrate-binding protein [Rhodococcus sp. G-MC3]|uniref:iron-siderophore ABC transporter substrate-binding protein n=1 Tax=Rhodococcus sp. G-MC3 TaxID=3046209 RepID=UPI0024BB6239|nr:iron-siderophore ABC transporter substrate-binding protein [Rhodococcus sp. G-MC3]MDJ0395992.1 iron-siderophore ABC transporter substrate-binding protein [Rhodococcus sp. G-MC3]
MRKSRLVLLVSAVVVAALTMSACSSDSGAAADGATVSTIFGDVTVPSNPQRVVALGWSDAETALALGVEPVGASDWLAVGGDGLGPWVDESYTTPPTMLGTYDVNIESVAALDPDLILWTRSTNDQATYDKLSALAPTVGAPVGTDIAYSTTWDGQTELVAQALGKEAQGHTLVSETTTDFDAAVADNPEFDGKSVAVGTLYSGQLGAYVDGDTRVEFMKKLGFTNSPTIASQAQPGKFAIDLSAENVAQLDSDLTVMFPIFSGADAITNDPSIQGLPSARDGRMVVLGDPDLNNAFSSASAAGTRYAIENAVPLFAASLKADMPA